jgi:hypothetical protein
VSVSRLCFEQQQHCSKKVCCAAPQVEEAYRSAESLAKALGIEANPVLRYEVPLLQGLKFDLVVHSPYRALAGLFKVCDNDHHDIGKQG